MSIEIETGALRDLDKMVQRLGVDAERSARMAVNDGARFAVRVGAQDIADELNLTKRYITGGSAPRLAVRQFASDADLEAVVTGRDRPTSLARFARSAPKFGRQRLAPTVKVAAKGSGERIKGSFFVRLKRGTQMDGENFNVGIAVRLKPGERLPGKRTMAVPGRNGFYLLYGPSVGQAYRSSAPRTAPAVGERVGNEFMRQINRKIGR